MNASTLFFYRSHLVLHIAANNTKKRYPSRTALYYSSCRVINITASTINNKEDLYPSVTNIKYHHHFFSTDNSTKEENKEEVESDATIAKESAQKFQQLMSYQEELYQILFHTQRVLHNSNNHRIEIECSYKMQLNEV